MARALKNLRDVARDKICLVITAKINVGILLCFFAMRVLMFLLVFFMLRILFNVFSMMFAKHCRRCFAVSVFDYSFRYGLVRMIY